jgi:aminomethyltransferase
MKNISEDYYSLLAIQGPKAVEAMQALSSIDLAAIKYYHFEMADFAGIVCDYLCHGLHYREVLRFV